MKHIKWTEANLRKARVLYDMLRTLYYKNYSPLDLNAVARNVGNAIYDIGPFFSGYISENALKVKTTFYGKSTSKELDKKVVHEHYHGRQNAGNVIVHHFIRQPNTTIDEFIKLLEPYCTTHITTAQENANLVKYQNAGDHWSVCYDRENIKLVHVGNERMLTQKYLKQFIKTSSKNVTSQTIKHK